MSLKSAMSNVLAILIAIAFTSPATARATDAIDSNYAEQLIEFWAVKRFHMDRHQTVPERARLHNEVLAKAEPDECFNGVGQPYPPMNPDKTCPAGKPKTNQAYVWGLSKIMGNLWFGTLANTHCLVESSFLDMADPQENPYWVCEFGQAQSPTRSDLRTPQIFKYNIATGALENKSPLSGPAYALLQTTIGFRSGGAINGVAFLAGPSFRGGINVFAYDAVTHQLLGAINLPQYNDIRNWVELRGVLYAGVGIRSISDAAAPGGAIIRWNGSASTDPNVLFNFEEVGHIESNAANLTTHLGQIYVASWPTTGGGTTRLAGLFKSPRVLKGGLTSADAKNWKKLWSADDYETDPIVAQGTAGGALASYKGALYWGTMHVPFSSMQRAMAAHEQKKIDLDADGDGKLGARELLATALGTHRSIALFKGVNLGHSDQKISIVYGETYLPRYDAKKKTYRVAFNYHFRNAARQIPTLGASGMGNFFNTYTWIMRPFRGSLYFGTFDWSQLARVEAQSLVNRTGLDPREWDRLRERFGASIPTEGGDLFRLREYNINGSLIAFTEAETLSGMGNDTNYGFRTVLTTEELMYIGSANPMNLHPHGGWELIEAK